LKLRGGDWVKKWAGMVGRSRSLRKKSKDQKGQEDS